MGLVYGIVTGVIFGFLLQRAHVLRYDKQVGALRILDMTIVKFMLSAIVVASIGIYLLRDLGLVELRIRNAALGAQLVGGGLFGIGWGLLGYCPGTAVGAFGEGRIDGLWGVLGMLFGGWLYATAYPFAKAHIIGIGSFGRITVPQAVGISHWIVIIALAAAAILLFRVFEKNNL